MPGGVLPHPQLPHGARQLREGERRGRIQGGVRLQLQCGGEQLPEPVRLLPVHDGHRPHQRLHLPDVFRYPDLGRLLPADGRGEHDQEQEPAGGGKGGGLCLRYRRRLRHVQGVPGESGFREQHHGEELPEGAVRPLCHGVQAEALCGGGSVPGGVL